MAERAKQEFVAIGGARTDRRRVGGYVRTGHAFSHPLPPG